MKLLKHINIVSLLCAGLLAGCGDAQNDITSDVQEEQGEVVISITDAPGDFASYQVDVLSLKLQRQDGLEVETLPLTTSINFTDYVDLTEFLTAASVPNGVYTSGSMTLDYSNAAIQVENTVGDIVPATSIVNEDGVALTTLEVRVSLDNANKLIVAPGVPAHITLDFDLNASNTVNFIGNSDVEIVVEPLLSASLERTGDKSHRARGALRSVNLEKGRYSIALRPFRHRFNNSERFGVLGVQTDDATVFEVDGSNLVGMAGLTELAELPALTRTIARGHFRKNPNRFVASEVYAGSSVPNGDQDVVTGSVIKRVGDVITIKGAALIRNDGSVVFNDTVELVVTESTVFTRQGSADPVSVQDLSVGQSISAYGELVETDAGDYLLEANAGRVRLMLTYLNGVVVENGSRMVMDLSRMGGRSPEIFDFTDTGVSTEFDADPYAYEVDKNGLSVIDIVTGSTVKVAGHVSAFGMAPADFVARTIADTSLLPALLRLSWQSRQSNLIDSSAGNSLVLGLEGLGRFHHVSKAGEKIDLSELESDPTVLLENGGTFVLVQNRVRQVHTDIATFIADLDTRFAEGSLAQSVEAHGLYNIAGNAISSRRVVVYLR